jgi:hypothetical protein
MLSNYPKIANAGYFWYYTFALSSRKWRYSFVLLFFELSMPGVVQAQQVGPPANQFFVFWTFFCLLLVSMLVITLSLAYRVYMMQRGQRLFEKKLLKEKEILALAYEEQQRFYANLIHEVIKGEAQSMLLETPAENSMKEQLTDFVKTCELGQYFVDKDNNDLYDLMKGMEFIFSSRLHSEMDERYFYCEIDPMLKGTRLNYRQKYELIFFLRECLNNIRKHAQSRHIGMKIKLKTSVDGPFAVLLEVNDDGIGLQKMLGIEEPEFEINETNLPQFFERYLKHRRCTGIREIFVKAARMGGQLVMRSVLGQGTKVELHFFPDPG